MKSKTPGIAIPLLVWCLSHAVATGVDFVVRTPSQMFIFEINGERFPTLTLVRGQTYTFDVQTANNHPFRIVSLGVANNDINAGTMIFSVPTNAANYFYDCVIHGAQMRGEIITVEPPRIEILSLAVGTNLVLTSTATNDWNIYPEYRTNHVSGNWYALTVQTNRLVNGGRETICGRPEGDTVLIRLRSSR